MDEEAKLKARIAQVQGQIKHKTSSRFRPYPANTPHTSNHPYAARGAGRLSRGRGGRGAYHRPHQNHVWVAGGTPTPPAAELSTAPNADASVTSPAGKNGFYIPSQGVGKKEIMSQETYEREQKQKEQYKQARALEAHQGAHASPAAPIKHVPVKTQQNERRMTIEGIAFQVSKDGSKLVRVSDVTNALQETPRKTTIAGVEFHRTKRGNLIRAPAHKDNTRSSSSTLKPQCETFTKQGSCPFGPKCRFAHDPEKVAICKTLLLTGTCSAGDFCDLSHEMTYHRVSACTHFLRGNCTNDACRYPHVNVSPSAPVCRAFATFGFCSSGEECSRRHVVECPDYANHGECANPSKCQLPHVDRASALRKAAQRRAKIGSEDESDLSSNDGGSSYESEVDEADPNAEDSAMTGLDDSHELSQQQDYISFS